MYLMPKEGSRVSLYFGSEDERSGRGINCIAQGGGSPNQRWLRTEHGKSLDMLEEEMSLTSKKGGTGITLCRSNVNLKGPEIDILGKEVNIREKKLYLLSKSGEIRMGSGVAKEGGTPTAYMGLAETRVDICGESGTMLEASGSQKNEPYPDGQQEGKFNWEKAASQAVTAVVVVGGSVALVSVTMGASTPMVVNVFITAGLAGASMVVSDAIKGEVSGWEAYALSVAGAELMYFTNLAATQLINKTGMGYVSGTFVKALSETAAEAVLDLMIEGEMDKERVSRNLAITTLVEFGSVIVSKEVWKGVEDGFEVGSGADIGYMKNNADPMRDVLGSGRISTPDEWNAILRQLEDNGVEIKFRDGNMAYAPGLKDGSPGQIVIDPDASLSALKHEYQHFLDARPTVIFTKSWRRAYWELGKKMSIITHLARRETW